MPAKRFTLAPWGYALLWFVGAIHAEEASRPQTPVDPLVAKVVALADAGDFAALETLLQEQQTATSARAALAPLLLYSAQQAYSQKNLELTQRWLERAKSLDAPGFTSAIEQGLEWSRLNPHDPAIPSTRLAELATNTPDTSLAAVGLALRAESLAAEKRYDEAIWVDHCLVRLFPQARCAAATMLHAAKLHYQLAQWPEAMRWCQRITEEHPTSPEADDALYWLGLAATKAGETARAEEAWTKLRSTHASSSFTPDATYRLAALYYQSDRRSFAEPLLAELQDQPSLAPALKASVAWLEAQLLIAKREWSGAKAPLEACLKNTTNEALQAAAQLWRAEVAFQLGELDDAQTRFQALVPRSTAAATPQGEQALRRLAHLATRNQQWNECLTHLNKLREMYPGAMVTMEEQYLRGRAYVGLGRFREARAELERLVDHPTARSTETAAMAQWLIGETYLLQERPTEALEAYEKTLAFTAFPQWQAAALLQAAKCCEQLKRPGDARRHYERLITEFATSQYAVEGRRRLNAEGSHPVATKPAAGNTQR